MEILPRRLEPARLVADRLTRARSIAVATHLGGDGDGWGSACAIAHHFGGAGAEVQLLAASAFPDRYRFLLPEGARLWEPDDAGLRALHAADVQLVVDASEPGRLGDFAPDFSPERTVVIDHHAVAFEHIEAAVALIDPTASATAELVYDVLALTDRRISTPAARAL